MINAEQVVWVVYRNYYDGLDHHQSTYGVYATEQDAVNTATTRLLSNRLLPDNEDNLAIFPNGEPDDYDDRFYVSDMVICKHVIERDMPPPDLSLFPQEDVRLYVRRYGPSQGRGFTPSKPESTAVVRVKAGQLEEEVELRMYHHAKVSEYTQLERVVSNSRDQVGEWMNLIEAEAKPDLMIHITDHETTGNLLMARGWRIVPKEELPGASRVTYQGRELMYGLRDGMWTFKGFDQAWMDGEVCYVKGEL